MQKYPRSLLKVFLFFLSPLDLTWTIDGFADRGGDSPELKKRQTKTFHQDYLVKNPGGYTCHYIRD